MVRNLVISEGAKTGGGVFGLSVNNTFSLSSSCICSQIFHQRLSGIVFVGFDWVGCDVVKMLVEDGRPLVKQRAGTKAHLAPFSLSLGIDNRSSHRSHQLRPVRLLALNGSIGQFFEKRRRRLFSEGRLHMVYHSAAFHCESLMGSILQAQVNLRSRAAKLADMAVLRDIFG